MNITNGDKHRPIGVLKVRKTNSGDNDGKNETNSCKNWNEKRHTREKKKHHTHIHIQQRKFLSIFRLAFQLPNYILSYYSHQVLSIR